MRASTRSVASTGEISRVRICSATVDAAAGRRGPPRSALRHRHALSLQSSRRNSGGQAPSLGSATASSARSWAKCGSAWATSAAARSAARVDTNQRGQIAQQTRSRWPSDSDRTLRSSLRQTRHLRLGGASCRPDRFPVNASADTLPAQGVRRTVGRRGSMTREHAIASRTRSPSSPAARRASAAPSPCGWRRGRNGHHRRRQR